MPNVLITGAASGLGRAFLHAYAWQLYSSFSDKLDGTKEDSTIYALDRSPAVHDIPFLLSTTNDSSVSHSNLLSWAHRHVRSFTLDITSPSSVHSFLNTELQGVPLDLVIHSAGIRGLVDDGSRVHNYGEVKNMENLDVMNADTMRKAFEVNVLGSFEVLRACVPGLKLAAARGSAGQNEGDAWMPKVIVMGSRMGSISHNTPVQATGIPNSNTGGAYAYRASKAALNAIVRSFAVDVPEAVWMVVHPGRVETGLVRVKEDGAMGVEDSVGEIVKLIERLEKEDSGRFVDRFGEDIPW